MEWKDATSYSRGDRGKVEPSVWEVESDGLRVALHRWVAVADKWFVTCYDLKIDKQPLSSKHMKVAAKEALSLVKETAKELYAKARELKDVEWPEEWR
jgi:hypothetical protein